METIEKKSLIYQISEFTNVGVPDISRILEATIKILTGDNEVQESYILNINNRKIQIEN